MFGVLSKVLSYFWRRAGDEEGEDERWADSGRGSWPRCGFGVADAGPASGSGALRALVGSSIT